MGMRRTTPSESATGSVEARTTFLSGFWQSTSGFVLASAHQNSLSGIWSRPDGDVLGDACLTKPLSGMSTSSGEERVTGTLYCARVAAGALSVGESRAA